MNRTRQVAKGGRRPRPPMAPPIEPLELIVNRLKRDGVIASRRSTGARRRRPGQRSR